MVNGVRVRYGAIEALRGVSLELAPGEVHGLVGHNGSGKSTLARLLAGNESPTAGTVLWDGKPLRIGAGVSVVHQSLGLAEDMTSLENYGVSSSYDTGRAGFIRWGREAASFAEHRSVLDIDVDPRQLVRDLSPAQRAGVALMRSLRSLEKTSRATRFVILDEITSYLDAHERARLASAVSSLAASGVGVVFISHYLDEVLLMCTKVSVLRAGEMLGTYDAGSMTKSDLSHLMFGATANVVEVRKENADVDTHTDTDGFSLRPFVEADIKPGEILGVTGRSGGDHELLPYLLISQMRGDRKGPTVTLVPSDRAARGIWIQGSIAENLTLSKLRPLAGRRGGTFAPRRERGFVRSWLAETNFRVDGPHTKLAALSGGMQQKVLVGRALLERPDVLVLHEPTQGIDVGARASIMKAILDAAKAGTAVLLVSHEHNDLVALCDSVLVCHEHEVATRLSGRHLTEPALAAAL